MSTRVQAVEVAGGPATARITNAREDGGLALVGLTKRFGGLVAVDSLDLTVPAGSFFALLGPSGCGKTTTLRMVAGLEQPTSGQILIGGQDVSGIKPYRRPVNTVFQSYALFPHLNVFDNVAFGLRRQGHRHVRAEVEAALELVALAGYGSRRPAELSGGQQQRVALARAVVNRPDVLLLDEPLGALDLQLRRQMQRELKRIQTEVGLTFVHVTHDQEEALTIADTIGVMNAGRIEQVADPATLYERPVTTFAANFLGQSNLLSAQVVGRGGDELVVEAAGQRLRMPLDEVTALAARAGTLWLGVRPEKLRLVVDDEQAPATNRLAGVVVDVVFTGVSIQYRVRLANDEQVTVIVQNDGAPLRRPGEDVTLAWAPQYSFGLGADQDASAGVSKGAE